RAGGSSCHGDSCRPGVGARGCFHGDPAPRCAGSGGGGRGPRADGLRRAASASRPAPPPRPDLPPGKLLHAHRDRRDRHRAPAAQRQTADRAR
ncbi:hypothetical protein M9458_049401, partial [Cirrhinus mrigala]